MTTIKATVRDGRIEPDEPLDLPEGTRLLIPLPNGADPGIGIAEENWSDSPEAVNKWLRWYDSLEPLLLTAAEQAAWEADRHARRDAEMAADDERDQRLRRIWE